MSPDGWTSTTWCPSATPTSPGAGPGAPEEKRRYANDLSYDNHLIAVQASANRAEGQQEPRGIEAAGPRLLVPVCHGLDSHQEHMAAHRG